MSRAPWLALLAFVAGCSIAPPTSTVQVFPDRFEKEWADDKWRVTHEDLAKLEIEGEIPVLISHGDEPLHGGAAAAFVKRFELRPTGLWAVIEWTVYGQRVACTGAYRFISPMFHFRVDADGFAHPTSVEEISLVNRPRIEKMAPVPPPPCGLTQRLVEAF